MVYCKFCAKNTISERDPVGGFLSCTSCGKVIDQDVYSTDVSFIKNAGGQSQMSGNFLRTVQSDYSESHERTLMKGRDEISDMVTSLSVGGGNSIIDQAFAFYKIAVERNFTRGRRTSQVAAACLYIACRENMKAYLLIDFSEYLQINVYVLGAVFLQLCKLLRLEEHPIVQKPVDPSLFIHRFTERLLGERNAMVSKTALRIIASMKRDWMQTGRKPSGLCGAALYISALSHGLKYSKSDIISVVHICEATLTKRLIEFENTESGSLTIEEFNKKAEELEAQPCLRQPATLGSKMSGTMELLCKHKGSSEPHFAHGLCSACYDDFIKLSGGLQGGSEPPAFQRAERERMVKASVEKDKEPTLTTNFQKGSNHNDFVKEIDPSSKGVTDVIDKRKLDFGVDFGESASAGAAVGHQVADETACNQPSHACDDMANKAGDESESLSDIDDVEVNGYLHNEEEKRYKKIIWEEMNREYLEEQAAKEAAAAAAKKAYEASFQNCSVDLLAAQELAAAAAAAVAKSKKERQQKRAAEARNAPPAKTAAEATRQMLTKKRLSSKINYDVLEKLFDDSSTPENKKKRMESDDAIRQGTDKKSGKEEVEPDWKDNNDELGQEEEYEENGSAYGDLYYENEDGYGYDEDYGYDDY